jgi:hypothetical protein
LALVPGRLETISICAMAEGIRSAKCAAFLQIPAVEHLEAPWHRIPDAAFMAQLFGNSQTGIEATMQRL